MPLPGARGVEGDRATVDLLLDVGLSAPIQARGVVIGINTTKEGSHEDLEAAFKAGVPVAGIEGALAHIVPVEAPALGEGAAPVGARSVLAVTISNWSAYDATPQEASTSMRLQNHGADTWTRWPEVPVHSFQALADFEVDITGDPAGYVYRVEVGDDPTALGDLTLIAGEGVARCDASDLDRRGYGVCARWLKDGEWWVLSVTAFSPDPDALPDAAPARLFALDARGGAGPSPTAGDFTLSFDPDRAAVFAIYTAVRKRERGEALAALLEDDAINVIGLSITTSAGPLTGTASGALVLGGAFIGLAPAAVSPDAAARRPSANGALVGGEVYPRVVPTREGGGAFTTPPLVIMQTTPAEKSNGKGTRNVASNTNSAPQLL